MRAYYNEHDPFAAAWLRELIKARLIADGDVDERDIQQVKGSDLDGYTQVHFFAGIAGWSYALRLAGWPDDRPVWTGSCPCQPFSSAGKRKGEADARHLWPEMRRLIAERSPAICFGEQVASDDGCQWLAGVFADLEELEYRVAGADLCAAGEGAPHIRQRLYWVANAERAGAEVRAEAGKSVDRRQVVARPGPDRQRESWANHDVTSFPNGDRRRIQSGGVLVVDGLPSDLVEGIERGYGNAIVPQVAARFIEASMTALEDCE